MLPPGGTGVLGFPDHHPYRAADVRRLVRAARRGGAGGFVTTAKDRVKLTGTMLADLERVGPVIVGELKVVPLHRDAVWARLRSIGTAGGSR